ncbi:MAG: hypothetical protein JWO85_1303 [Candidatus Eremiobacteraeota bacterium]|nr:hypothetical protein [Candidatus Eremiobacteraeota bacterium]
MVGTIRVETLEARGCIPSENLYVASDRRSETAAHPRRARRRHRPGLDSRPFGGRDAVAWPSGPGPRFRRAARVPRGAAPGWPLGLLTDRRLGTGAHRDPAPHGAPTGRPDRPTAQARPRRTRPRQPRVLRPDPARRGSTDPLRHPVARPGGRDPGLAPGRRPGLRLRPLDGRRGDRSAGPRVTPSAAGRPASTAGVPHPAHGGDRLQPLHPKPPPAGGSLV